MATTLAAIGLFGVLAYWVNQKERQIGVRVALGANTGEVPGLVVRKGITLAGTGFILGMGSTLLGGRLVGSLLYGVEPPDPLSLGVAGALLAMVALLACVTPGWRAASLPPAEALRSQ